MPAARGRRAAFLNARRVARRRSGSPIPGREDEADPVIIDLERFVARERLNWRELEGYLHKHEERTDYRMTADEAQRFVYLYERCSSALARLAPGGVAADVRNYVESLVARAYAEIHEARRDTSRPRPIRWFLRTFPQIFRRHI